MSRTVLVLDHDGRWVLADAGWWTRLRARLQAPVLDAQLAAGASTGTDRLRAVRAAQLVDPAYRTRLAAGWERARGRGRLPVLRDRARAAEAEIAELVAALRVAQPVPARGVAAATALLTDAVSPLHHVPSRQDLRAAVRRAVRDLDPARALLDDLPPRG